MTEYKSAFYSLFGPGTDLSAYDEDSSTVKDSLGVKRNIGLSPEKFLRRHAYFHEKCHFKQKLNGFSRFHNSIIFSNELLRLIIMYCSSLV